MQSLASEELDVFAERILDAAREQLEQFGLRRTSLDDIARAAQVGRATLFRRFANRDALLGAMAAREAQGAIARVDARLAGVDDPADFLVAAVVAVIHEFTGNRLLQRLLETDSELMLPLLAGPGAPIVAMGREYIAAQLRRIDVPLNGDPEVLGELLARAVLSLALNRESVLPLGDDAALEQVARETFVAMVIA